MKCQITTTTYTSLTHLSQYSDLNYTTADMNNKFNRVDCAIQMAVKEKIVLIMNVRAQRNIRTKYPAVEDSAPN